MITKMRLKSLNSYDLASLVSNGSYNWVVKRISANSIEKTDEYNA